ncbi:right-handed parallel beta-helix repeat-containing protein [Chitinophagaceae bacterium LB-8]|uniref:Right-handed parallel beta-helix repeat-containing protein n=1 Tax=Paraflavisolibacter caeni TaxID=2982496 RepID=A0A9X3B9W3_9BACT|nr:right-handed parallel beta-helix repeat-containing protein [Paraflavisolibacter caeni]MCU7552560.1 right-handed parallel beta-helix repeat-containing protein [Paraflavisolibacter caeni]
MNRLFILLLFFLPFHVMGQNQRTCFVSINGKDSNPGTLEKPFATLQKARSVVREQKKLYPDDAFTIFIRQGSYFLADGFQLDSLDSGTEKAPVTYSAYQDEKVYFTGGVTIPVQKAVAVSNASILSRLLPEARAKVLQVNLKALGIKNYGSIKPKGFGRPYTNAAMELFCNKEAMKPARWPNDSLVPIGKVLDQGSIPRNGDFSGRGGKFTYNVQRPEWWTKANDVWISGFFRYGYADDAVKIARLDTANKTFTTAQETMYGFEGGKIFQRWYAFNLLEEIDVQGEYYIDRDAGMLYFLPPAGELQSIELSITEAPLLVMENTSYVHFNNINFECARGMGVYIERGKENKLEHCTFSNLGMVAVSIGKGIHTSNGLQHTVTGQPASRMIGSLYGHLYSNTTFDREAGTGHVISNCQIYNAGSGGIILGGGNRLTLEKGNNQVVNCRIYNFNRIERSYKAGINIDGVGNIIRNCEIYNCPGSAILLHGNDHLIEKNNIHHAVTDGDDMGAVYYGRDPSEFGNKVRHNFFHHLGNDHGYLVAVYHDDGACGMEVYGNVFYKSGSRASLIGGGNDNVYRNNLFIDCQQAIHLDNRLQGWAKSFVNRNDLFEKRLQAVNYQQPPYASAYPSLTNYFDDKAGLPKRNYIEGNVFINTKMISDGKAEWSDVGKNLTLFGNPGFADMEKMNFELLPGAEIFKLMPEFKKIPFHEIGIQ